MDAIFSIDSYIGRGLALYSIQVIRYLLFAGIAWLIFYKIYRSQWLHRKIQQRFPKPKVVLGEIKYSFLTLVIFCGVGMTTYWATQNGWTKMYADVHQYSWGYYALSILLSIIIHDTYFYWSHRLMHVKWIFPYVHRVHHLSHNPSPWAAFAFHPIEAVIEAGIVFVIVFVMPIHASALLIFLLYMTGMNVMGHLGFELFPKGFTKHWLSGWYNTSTHHNMHHHYSKCNYGLYFNFWDRIMGTNHVKYHETFEKVASKEREKASEVIPSPVIGE